MSADAPLAAIEQWIGGYLARLDPGQRVKLSRRIGVILRRTNAKRIAANTQPDGSDMEARKPRLDRRGRLRKSRKGKMFRQTGKLRNMRIRARPDEVEVFFGPAVAGTAKVHHFGLVDTVDKNVPTAPRIRYPIRRLLGLPPEDREAIMDEVMEWLDSQ